MDEKDKPGALHPTMAAALLAGGVPSFLLGTAGVGGDLADIGVSVTATARAAIELENDRIEQSLRCQLIRLGWTPPEGRQSFRSVDLFSLRHVAGCLQRLLDSPHVNDILGATAQRMCRQVLSDWEMGR